MDCSPVGRSDQVRNPERENVKQTGKETWTHQFRTFPALIVCKKTEAFVAVTFQEDHASRWASISVQAEMKATLQHERLRQESLLLSVTYLVAVAMHIALASPISGHLTA